MCLKSSTTRFDCIGTAKAGCTVLVCMGDMQVQYLDRFVNITCRSMCVRLLILVTSLVSRLSLAPLFGGRGGLLPPGPHRESKSSAALLPC